MKKLCLFMLGLLSVFAGIAQQDIVIDPNASVRTVQGSFESIKVSGGIDLFLSQSQSTAIAVSAASDQYKANIKTVIENGTLRIYYEGEKNWSKSNRKLRAYVSFAGLKKLEASGACDVFVSGSIAGQALEIQLSGACDFKGMVKVNTLDINLSGASDVKISGTANTVNIKNTGASDVQGYDLQTDYCHANASGASDIHITVNKEMHAVASGSSDIHFKGNGEIREQKSSGSSSITKKN